MRRQQLIHLLADEGPGALLPVLLLHPGDFHQRRIPRQQGLQRLRRERIELLDPRHRQVRPRDRAPPAVQVVIDLAAAQQQALDLTRILDHRVVDDRLETAPCQLLDPGVRSLLPIERALGRHHDQRLAQRVEGLPAQQVEPLRRRRRAGHAQVVLAAQLQEAAQVAARVVRPDALVAMRQQHRQRGGVAPLLLARADVLVDEDLRAVDEVAELRFPHRQRARGADAVAVLEAQHRLLGQRRVVDVEAAAGAVAGRHLAQRHELRGRAVARAARTASLLRGPDRLAVQEGAAAHVHAGDPHVQSAAQDGGVGQVLGEAPVGPQRRLGQAGHAPPVVDQRAHHRMRLEAVGQPRHRVDQRLHAGRVQGRHRARPAQRRRRLVLGGQRGIGEGLVSPHPATRHVRGQVGVGRHDAVGAQRRGVAIDDGRVRLRQRMDARSRQRRHVAFRMAEPAVADQVDDDVGAEARAPGHRDRGGPQRLLGLVRVHAQDRRVDHAGDVGAVLRGPGAHRVGLGEADLVVDDHVHRAANRVARLAAQHQRLHHHALPREGGVAMQHQRQHQAPAVLVGALAAERVLAGARQAGQHRMHALQVGRVVRQRQRQAAARRVQLALAAQVIDQVGVALRMRRLRIEVVQHPRRREAHQVDQHVDPPAVRHAQEDPPHAVVGRLGAERVQQRDQRLVAFQREALRMREGLGDMLLPALRADQPVQQREPLRGTARHRRRGLHLVMQPVAPRRVAHRAGVQGQAAAVDRLERAVQVADGARAPQRRAGRRQPFAGLQAEALRIEQPRIGGPRHAQRVEPRAAVAVTTVRLDEGQHLGPPARRGGRRDGRRSGR